MSVKIMPKIKLDSNFYNKLIIREEVGNFFVKVSGPKQDDKYEITSYKLTDTIKNMNDSEKIFSIVDSFLENAIINCIELSTHCVGTSGLFIKISGSRELYLQIDNYDLLKEIFKKIKSKYDRDRYLYLNNSDIKNSYIVFLNKDVSCYSREFISCDECEYLGDCEKSNGICPKCIQFRLMYSNGKMASFDKKFIERFVYDKLWEVGLNAEVREIVEDILLGGMQKVGVAVRGYCISCGDLKIVFNCSAFSREYVMNICNNIVNKYNGELSKRESVKKRQLKMEGF